MKRNSLGTRLLSTAGHEATGQLGETKGAGQEATGQSDETNIQVRPVTVTVVSFYGRCLGAWSSA